MKNKIKIILALIGFMSLPVSAQSITNIIKPVVSLAGVCLLSTTNVVFGPYNPNVTADQTTTQKVSILCTRGTAWNYYQYAAYYSYAGATNSTPYASAMIANGNKLYYQVQMSDGVWDNDVDMPGRPNSGHFVGKGTGLVQNLTLNYRIMKNQYIPPGHYSDTAIAYLEF